VNAIERALMEKAPDAFAPMMPTPAPVVSISADATLARARAYLNTIEPAIEGQGGDAATYRAACVLVRDFNLPEPDALALLSEWNTRCVPPWTLSDLETKVRNAGRYGEHSPGAKLTDATAVRRKPSLSPGDSEPHTPEAATDAPIAERLPAFMSRLRDRQRPPDIITELVPGIGITMVHGQPRSLKTWALDEIALSSTCGDMAFGLERFSVPTPIQTWSITEEDPDLDVRDRFGCLLAGRGLTTPPEGLHVSVHRRIRLDDPEQQARMIAYAREHQIKLTIIDPIRASSTAVDQGPREINPLATFFRLYMLETGSAVALGHHDTKPLAGKPDERAKPQRASGGGIFSIADSPIHAELVGPGSRSILTPSLYKYSTAPDPFVIVLDADDPKRPTWVRLRGETTTAAVAAEVSLHERILEYLRNHPATPGSKVATGIHVNKATVLNALDAMRLGGLVDYYKRGQAQLWSALSVGVES
jgi:hypothetical protein